MSALVSAVLVPLLGAVTREGAARISKTKAAANLGGINAAVALLPGVMERDPTAIGQLVLLVLTWLATLWGRGSKG